MPASASSRGSSSRPWRSASSTTAASHAGPSCHQCPSSSVSSAQTREAAARQAPACARDEVGRVARACAGGGARGVVDAAVVGPRVVVARRAPVGVAVGARRPGSRRRSTRARSSARSIGTSSGPAVVAIGRRWRSSPGRGRRSGRRTSACTPASSSSGSSQGAWAHSGSQKPPAQPRSPRRARWAAMPAASCSRTPASVASSGSTAWVALLVQLACGASAATRSPRQRLEALGRARGSRRPRARARRRRRGRPRPRSARRRGGATRGRTSRRKVRKRSATPGASSWSQSTGVSDSVSGAPRVEQRRAAAGRRSPSPPTATPRRTATSRSPRRRACGCAGRCSSGTGRSGAADGEEVERAIEVRALLGRAQREVARRDGRREAVVEAASVRPRRAVHVVPARVLDAPTGAGAACARGRGRAARRSRSAPRTARGTPAARYSLRCHGLPDFSAPSGGRASARWASRRRRRRRAARPASP